MKEYTKIKNITKVLALTLAIVALLSVVFGAPVSAATGDKATIWFDYCYDTGGSIISFVRDVTVNGRTIQHKGEDFCRIYAGNKDAYCIQPGHSLYSGNELTEGKSATWTALSKDKQKAINIAMLYGKPGNAQNLGYTEGQQWIATQIIVWEIIEGCRDTGAGFKCNNEAIINGISSDGYNPGVKAVYNKIASAMANHHTVPSFASVLDSKAPTHMMDCKDGLYSVTLNDTNGVLSQFAYKTTGNVAVKVSGNSVTFSTYTPITDEKTWSVNKTVPSVGNSVLLAFGDDDKQDVITGVAAPDPVPSVLRLKTNAGGLKIIKTAEDGNIANIEFTVTGESFRQTVKTDDKGELNLSGLVPGTYTVTEVTSDKYVNQSAQTITVENGKVAEVRFNNIIKKGGLGIIKTSEDGVVDNIEFTVTGNGYSKTVKTDEKGIINLSDLTPGTYTVTESKSDEYVTQEPKTVTVEYGKTATISFANVLKKGTITIYKTGDIFSSVTEEEMTEPITKPSAQEKTVPVNENAVSEKSATDTAEETTPTDEETEGVGKPEISAEENKSVIKYQPVYKHGGLADAEFTVTAAEDIKTPDGTVQYKKGDVVDTVTTNNNGVAKTKTLYVGKYSVTETKSPFGFIVEPKQYTVELTYAGQDVEIINTDITIENIRQKAVITLQKVLEKNELVGIGVNDEISNVAFALFADEDIIAADGKMIPKDGLIEIISCAENGKVCFNTEIPFGKYYVQEYSTDRHYVIDDTKYPFEFTYSTDTDVQHFDISNGKEFVNELISGTIYTTKVDADYPENKLTGAKFEIYADIDGDKQFNTDVDKLIGEMKESPVKTGVYYLNELPVGGYFLYEKEAPEGFVKDDGYYYFAINEDDEAVTVENKAGIGFINKPFTGELEITKKDVAIGKPIPKAGFRIKDVGGNVVTEGYTDENGIAKFKLRAGKYTYEEFDAPDGYIIDSTPHEFEIKEDGQIIKAEMTNVKETPPTTPQTGDYNPISLIFAFGAIALGGIVACVILFVKRKKEDGEDE